MPRKMTKFVLNDLCEEINFFLEKASSGDQIRSSTFFSLQFYIQVAEVLTLCQPKIQQFPFIYHFLKKLKMP